MNWLTKSRVLALVIVAAGLLAAGPAEGSTAKNAASSLSPGQSMNVSLPTFSPRTRAARPTTARATGQATTAAAAPALAAAPQAAETPTLSPAAGGSGSSHPWIWIVLGAFVIAALAALIARYFGRR